MFPIVIDTSSLTYPWFLIPGNDINFHDGVTAATLMLSAGTFSFQQASGYFADFEFQVTPAGTVDYDAVFDGFLSGRGSATLKVGGFAIEVDLTALSSGLLLMIAGNQAALMPDAVHQIVLAPASHYGFQPTSGVVANFEFGVDRSGNVVVDPRYSGVDPKFSGFATGAGNRLTIRGYPIQVDGRRLTNDLLPMIGLNLFSLPRTAVHTLTLIPAAGYGFQPGSGLVADSWFDVRWEDGTLDYSLLYDHFLHGRGEKTLTVLGYPVIVDATQADSDLVGLIDTGQHAQTPRFLFGVLLPCQGYRLQTLKDDNTDGIFGHTFNLGRDGTVTVDPSPVPGRMVVTTVPSVEISGKTPI